MLVARADAFPPQGFFNGSLWDILGSLGTIFVGLGLGIAAYEMVQNRKARQDAISDQVFRDIQELEAQLGLIDRDDLKYHYKYKNWFSAFYNMMEYFAFRVNNNVLTDKKRLDFFCPIILYWYDIIFQPNAGAALNDPKRYEELKVLHYIQSRV